MGKTDESPGELHSEDVSKRPLLQTIDTVRSSGGAVHERLAIPMKTASTHSEALQTCFVNRLSDRIGPGHMTNGVVKAHVF
ncbi:MAG: hypothetical protein R3B53_04680 [Candidatus Paceibacterota bacterium]